MDCPFSTMYNYLYEDGHCSRCPAYQDCNNAVAPICEDEDEDEDDGDWVVTSEEPI